MSKHGGCESLELRRADPSVGAPFRRPVVMVVYSSHHIVSAFPLPQLEGQQSEPFTSGDSIAMLHPAS